MKKIFSIFAALLFAGSMMAEHKSEVFDFSDGYKAITVTTAGTSSPGGDYKFSQGDITVTGTLGYIKSGSHIVYKSGTMVVTAGGATIDSVLVKYNNCYPFAEAVPSGGGSTSKTSATVKYIPTTATDSVKFTNAAGGKTELKGLTVYYTPTPTAPLTAITISIPENVQLKKEYIVGTSFDVTGIKAFATYEGVSEEEDVTKDVVWTLDPATFESVAENASVKVKASINEVISNELEISGITVRNMYTYTITWLDKNETFATTTVDEGEALVLPATNPTCEAKEFVGWTAMEEIPENATEEEMTFVTETTIPVADATYRAVFANAQIVGTAEWQLVTSAEDLKAGSKLLMVSSDKGKIAAGIEGSNTYLSEVVGTFDNGVCTPSEGALQLTLGGTSAAWTLANEEGQLLGTTEVKKVAWNSGTTTWTITIDSETHNATIQSTTEANGRFLHNVNSTRFTTYTSNTSTSMLLPQLYKWGQNQSYTNYSFDCPSTPSDIESVSAPATTVQKTIENGQLIILRDGKKYNAMGVRVN